MKSWTPSEQAKFREVMGGIAEGLQSKALSSSQIGNFIKQKLRR